MGKGPKKRYALGFDLHGNPLKQSGEEVDAKMRAAFDHPDSQLHLVVYTFRDELFVQILGEPTLELAETLEQAARQLRDILGLLTPPPAGRPS